jgi:hypothetical protein
LRSIARSFQSRLRPAVTRPSLSPVVMLALPETGRPKAATPSTSQSGARTRRKWSRRTRSSGRSRHASSRMKEPAGRVALPILGNRARATMFSSTSNTRTGRSDGVSPLIARSEAEPVAANPGVHKPNFLGRAEGVNPLIAARSRVQLESALLPAGHRPIDPGFRPSTKPTYSARQFKARTTLQAPARGQVAPEAVTRARRAAPRAPARVTRCG